MSTSTRTWRSDDGGSVVLKPQAMPVWSFYRHRHERRLAEFSAIEVDLLSTAPNQRNSRAFEVELANDSRKNQVVGLFDDGDAALAHARQLSAAIGLPVLDQRYTEPPADE